MQKTDDTSGIRDDYRIERFGPVGEDGTQDARGRAFCRAVEFGFHGPESDDAAVAKLIDAYRVDNQTWTGAYAAASSAPGWDPETPVATYATVQKTINAGGALIDGHLITAVTVRPTHRRRGLLRRIMSADLRRARDEGLPLAALTASEATIYGRFGFGAATAARKIEVDVRERFAITTAPVGSVEVVDPQVLLEWGPRLFDRFHARTPGSVGRHEADRLQASGQWSEHKPEKDPSVRAALHYDEAGVPDGYVSYKYAGRDAPEGTLRVLDLVAADQPAYLELWRYLGSVDLINTVRFDLAPQADPLPWALADRRCYRVTGEADVLWLRLLDVPAALRARHWAADGRITLDVTDPLGLAGGRYRVETEHGRATIERVADSGGQVSTGGAEADGLPDGVVQVDIANLSSLYLGGADAVTLAEAGRITGDEADVARLAAMMRADRAPYCMTEF